MIYGFSPIGIMGHLVKVEVDIRRGLPGTDIVGLPGSEVKEARERVRVAIRNSGYEYPAARILINLSPAEIPKIGAGFDIPIALAILAKSEQIPDLGDVLAVGELSIRGEAIPVRGTVSAILTAIDRHFPRVVIPERARRAIRSVHADISRLATINTLRGLHIHGFQQITAVGETNTDAARSRPAVFPTFDDMRGQGTMKWAAAIAAAGKHNVLFMGPPGSGKTMAARRVVGLLPDLPERAAREVARIYSMRGIDGRHPGFRPPFRVPHHSSSLEGMLGGGRVTLPGEVSLAHNGLLLLDEATEFRPNVLQALREPVEARSVTLSRAGRADHYPASFQLLLTSNLCPCGKLGQPDKTCMCSLNEIERYWRRLGAALLDRVDIRIRSYYARDDDDEGITHQELRDRVLTAIARQRRRVGEDADFYNGSVQPENVEQRLPLRRSLLRLLQKRMQQLELSDRAAMSVRSVARTIADMDDRDEVEPGDILEAARLRSAGPERLA